MTHMIEGWWAPEAYIDNIKGLLFLSNQGSHIGYGLVIVRGIDHPHLHAMLVNIHPDVEGHGRAGAGIDVLESSSYLCLWNRAKIFSSCSVVFSFFSSFSFLRPFSLLICNSKTKVALRAQTLHTCGACYKDENAFTFLGPPNEVQGPQGA